LQDGTNIVIAPCALVPIDGAYDTVALLTMSNEALLEAAIEDVSPTSPIRSTSPQPSRNLTNSGLTNKSGVACVDLRHERKAQPRAEKSPSLRVP
jgi:hypothetical protein